jgi:hypothetical protein
MTHDSQSVARFYTLSPISIFSVDLPANLGKKLPKRPIGATLIGRLGRNQSLRGSGTGEQLYWMRFTKPGKPQSSCRVGQSLWIPRKALETSI